MQKARELWDNIMTKGNAKYANMWLEYYNLERFVCPSEWKVIQFEVMGSLRINYVRSFFF